MRANRFASVIIATASFSMVLLGETQAQSAADNEAEIAALKQRLLLLERKLEALQKPTAPKTKAAAKSIEKVESKPTEKVEKVESWAEATSFSAYTPFREPLEPSGVVVTMPGNRPTICTADNLNCISVTSRVHFDAGGYDFRPNTAATNPQHLDDGVNARRARIGVIGKFLGDWNYSLVYDFGGSSDGFAGTASFGAAPPNDGTTIGFLPGGGLSGIEIASLGYSGFKPFGGQLVIAGGFMDTLYTLDNAMSSNDILFMERASPVVTAFNIAAGDNRSAVGARWYTDTFWAGAYATGPTSGAIHSASSLNPNGTSEQFGAFARVAGQVISGKDYSLYIGGGAEFLIDPPQNRVTQEQTLTLSDRRNSGSIRPRSSRRAQLRMYLVHRTTVSKQRGLMGLYSFKANISGSISTATPPLGCHPLVRQGCNLMAVI